MTSRLRAALLAFAVALVLALSGCVSLPDESLVQAGPSQGDETQSDAPFDYTPSGPRRGDSPIQVVDGFLQAMTATPIGLSVARQFLADSAKHAWAPQKGTVVYGSETTAQSGRFVSLELADTVRLDGRGEWLGNTTSGHPLQYKIELVREKGQWRVSNPPDVIVIPQSHFESRYQQYFLYFFDKSAQALVPEPVYLPRGEQAPTLLVRGLLRGPDQDLLGVERTFLPSRAELEISVPVQGQGTAEVPLSDEILDLDGEHLQPALAQLAWTLKQVPGVERMQVTVDGSPIDVPGRGTELDTDAWPEYDPAVNWASQDLFGIRDGRVVNLMGDQERRISGLFGSASYGLRSIAVDLSGELIVGVSANGATALLAPRSRDAGGVPRSHADVIYSGGHDLLKPAWDLYGGIWLVDRGRDGASVAVRPKGGETRKLKAPGLTGEDVTAFVLSRDGTRLVAVIGGAGSDRLVMSRVLRAGDGTVRRLMPATNLPVGAIQVDEIRDLAWRTPGSLALLTGPTPGVSQVIISLLDGSSALGDVATNAEIFRDEARRIVTSPATGSVLYIGTTGGQLFQLAATGRWTGTSIHGGLRSATYVG